MSGSQPSRPSSATGPPCKSPLDLLVLFRSCRGQYSGRLAERLLQKPSSESLFLTHRRLPAEHPSQPTHPFSRRPELPQAVLMRALHASYAWPSPSRSSQRIPTKTLISRLAGVCRAGRLWLQVYIYAFFFSCKWVLIIWFSNCRCLQFHIVSN